MYTIPKNTELSPEVIKDAIAYNETLRSRYDELENYYLGKHAITFRHKPDTLINNRIVINHAKYITDINIGYLLGNPVTYQVPEEYEIEPLIEEYERQTIADLDHEIAKDVSIFGKQYELTYTVGNEVRSKDIDNRNCIIVYDDSIDNEKLFGIIYRKGKSPDEYDDILVYDSQFEYQYVQKGKIVLRTITPHYFGEVPIVAYRNNADELGDFEVVTSLIDAYNLLQSDRINDKEQLVDALLIIYGMSITPEQRASMRDSRMLAGLDKDTKVEFLTKQLNEADADVLRAVLEQDIHKISMTPNMSDENFANNSSGVALRFKLLPFEQSVKNKERYMEKGLINRFRLYNNYLVKLSKMAEVPAYKVDAVFKRNLPQNDLETSQMIANLSGLVDSETLLGQISFVKDVEEVKEALEEEKSKELEEQNRAYGTSEAEQVESEVNNELLNQQGAVIQDLQSLNE